MIVTAYLPSEKVYICINSNLLDQQEKGSNGGQGQNDDMFVVRHNHDVSKALQDCTCECAPTTGAGLARGPHLHACCGAQQQKALDSNQ
jgi:hypothetical protein